MRSVGAPRAPATSRTRRTPRASASRRQTDKPNASVTRPKPKRNDDDEAVVVSAASRETGKKSARVTVVDDASSSPAGSPRRPRVSIAVSTLVGGPSSLLRAAESYAEDAPEVAATLARLALDAFETTSSSCDVDALRRVAAIEREYAAWFMEEEYYASISRAARGQRYRDRAKPKTRARDRACNQPKARQGWAKREMRVAKTRVCVACEKLSAQESMFRVIRVKKKAGGQDAAATTEVLCGEEALGAHGRSAYVCKTRACVLRATKNKSLSRGLRCPVPNAVYDDLSSRARALEERAGTDTTGLAYVRPEGISARWLEPPTWVDQTPS
jgi:predicted RNA-binding protein YlxR (DUF448 family)